MHYLKHIFHFIQLLDNPGLKNISRETKKFCGRVYKAKEINLSFEFDSWLTAIEENSGRTIILAKISWNTKSKILVDESKPDSNCLEVIDHKFTVTFEDKS